MSDGDETKIKVSPVEVLTVREVGSGYVYLGIHGDDGRVYAHAMPDGAQCDALIAALHKALGRAQTPLEASLLALAEEEDRLAAKADWPDCHKYERAAEAYRAALAMAREAGPTVPRAAVAALISTMEQWYPAHNEAAETCDDASTARYQEGKTHGIMHCLDAVKALLDGTTGGRATLEAAGLWPVAAPATTALRGELLMSGQTEAIDALDRLAKDGEG